MITDINQLDFSKRYTYGDYLTWQFDEMVELIKGKIYKMSPAPGSPHQSISMEFSYQIKHFLRKKQCKAFHAPFDVILPLPAEMQTPEKATTVVQPDLCVICDLEKITPRGCTGAPDWVIEILSKGTMKKDLNEKFEIYQNAGVKEYWIVSPTDATTLIYVLDKNGKYQLIRQKPFLSDEKAPVNIFEGFEIDLEEIFQ